jgi:putative molybdopterin biosynthesis protein
MDSIQPLQSFEQLKQLSDPRRLAILRKLMAGPASQTMLGRELGEHPAWVRYHLKKLEAAGLVELVETRLTAGVVEKFYRAHTSGLLLQQLVLPDTSSQATIVFSGSHDLGVELLAEQLAGCLNILTIPLGSLDGLVTLRQKLCHFSGCHLLDKTGEYNLPFVEHLFPDRRMQAVTLAYREQGLMTAPGNPKAIRTLADLARAEVSIVNRNPGSGTRLWFDQQLLAAGIPPASIHGYETAIRTHTECARLVQSGSVDAAIGLRAAACLYKLGFIPLFHERYDLIFPADSSQMLAPLLDTLQTSAFRRGVEALTGYETTHTGEQILH